MKKSIFAVLCSVFLFGCDSPEGAPPDEVGEFPPDYIISMEGGEEGGGMNDKTSGSSEDGQQEGEMTTKEGETTTEESDDIFACREENAELSLDLDATKTRLAECQSELAQKPESESSAGAMVMGLKPTHLQLIKDSILNTDQVEYPFGTCGQMGTFFRSTWFDGFTRELSAAKIRFANGFLEAEDLFGGCQSTEGKMAFFLGAERGDTIAFILLKYDTVAGALEPAVMLDDASTAVVTEFGRREGSFVNFPADDGRTFRYYYDSNVVVEAP